MILTNDLIELLQKDGFTKSQAYSLGAYLTDNIDEDNPLDIDEIRYEFAGYKSLEDSAEDYMMTVEELEDNALIIYCNNGEVVVEEF